MDELHERLAGDRIRVPAEQRAPRRRRVHDRPQRVEDRDEVVDALEDEVLERRQIDEVVTRRFAHHGRIGPAHLTPAPTSWSSQSGPGGSGWEVAETA